MKLDKMISGAKEMTKKIGVKTLASAGAVALLGCVVVLSFVLGGGEENKNKLAIDLASSAEDRQESTPTLSADEVTDYFAAISLQRRQARDETMEVLASVAGSDTALEEAKQAALEDINRLALDIEREANIETLVQSKGFEKCIAVISEDKCNVIVQSSGLMPGEVAQISEIVYEQTGIVPENLKIIEKKTAE